MAEKSGVQSVERIFQLIEHLAAHPTGVSLQRLAEETGLAKSTVHRLLASLQRTPSSFSSSSMA